MRPKASLSFRTAFLSSVERTLYYYSTCKQLFRFANWPLLLSFVSLYTQPGVGGRVGGQIRTITFMSFAIIVGCRKCRMQPMYLEGKATQHRDVCRI